MYYSVYNMNCDSPGHEPFFFFFFFDTKFQGALLGTIHGKKIK